MVPFGYKTCLYATRAGAKSDPESDAAVAHKLGLETVRRATLEEVASESDVVFVLAPGGPATYHVVDEAFLKRMKRTAVLVNTARGTLVDSDALKKALDEGWIWGAGLDVVEGEPQVGLDHPLVKHPRCVYAFSFRGTNTYSDRRRCAILPHIGSATTETRTGMATLTVKNLLAGLAGEPMPSELKL